MRPSSFFLRTAHLRCPPRNHFGKVDVLPPKLRTFRTDPVLIRETQPVAADEQHFGVCHPQRFQCFPHTAAACRNRAIPPPVVKRRTVGDLVSHRDADRQMLRYVDTANFCIKPVTSSSSSSATGVRLCIKVHFIPVVSFRLLFCDFSMRSCACSSLRFSILSANGAISLSCR